jgi:inosose dehydratase
MFASPLSRRRFIVSALASSAVTSSLLEAASSADAVTLGFNTYGMKSLTTEDAIRELAKIGYDTIELDSTAGTDGDPMNLTSARRADLRKMTKDLGLKFTAVQGVRPPSIDEKQHAANLERFKVLAQLCHDLDPGRPPLIECGLGGRDPFEKMKPFFVKRVADWVKVAESSDIHIVVKPHRDTSMDRPDQAIELFKDLGNPPRLRMSWDYSHFALRDLPLAETIRVALPYTGFVAIKDVAMENGRGVFKLPGETKQIDYPALLKGFYQGGYRGDFNCEISSMIFTKPGFDCLAAARISYANIAPAFAAAGVPRARRS